MCLRVGGRAWFEPMPSRVLCPLRYSPGNGALHLLLHLLYTCFCTCLTHALHLLYTVQGSAEDQAASASAATAEKSYVSLRTRCSGVGRVLRGLAVAPSYGRAA